MDLEYGYSVVACRVRVGASPHAGPGWLGRWISRRESISRSISISRRESRHTFLFKTSASGSTAK